MFGLFQTHRTHVDQLCSIDIFLLISTALRETVYFRLVVFIDWTCVSHIFPECHTMSLILRKKHVEYQYQSSNNMKYCPMLFQQAILFCIRTTQTKITGVSFSLNLHYLHIIVISIILYIYIYYTISK